MHMCPSNTNPVRDTENKERNDAVEHRTCASQTQVRKAQQLPGTNLLPAACLTFPEYHCLSAILEVTVPSQYACSPLNGSIS